MSVQIYRIGSGLLSEAFVAQSAAISVRVMAFQEGRMDSPPALLLYDEDWLILKAVNFKATHVTKELLMLVSAGGCGISQEARSIPVALATREIPVAPAIAPAPAQLALPFSTIASLSHKEAGTSSVTLRGRLMRSAAGAQLLCDESGAIGFTCSLARDGD